MGVVAEFQKAVAVADADARRREIEDGIREAKRGDDWQLAVEYLRREISYERHDHADALTAIATVFAIIFGVTEVDSDLGRLGRVEAEQQARRGLAKLIVSAFVIAIAGALVGFMVTHFHFSG